MRLEDAGEDGADAVEDEPRGEHEEEGGGGDLFVPGGVDEEGRDRLGEDGEDDRQGRASRTPPR